MASWCRLRCTLNWHIAPARTPHFPELKRLREVCARAVDPGFATHPNYGHAKHLCAWHALGLMRELSDGKITGTKDAAFRVVTGLLYEAVSGQPDADLKRACDTVLQNVDIGSGTD